MSPPDHQGMPIEALRPGCRPLVGLRPAAGPPIDSVAPSEELLPSVGARPRGHEPRPDPAPATDALRVLGMLHDHPRDVGCWGAPAFAREVDRIRAQLAPIASRHALVSSFGREASLLPGGGGSSTPADLVPLGVAYAVRWLELGDGRSRPPWSDLVADRA